LQRLLPLPKACHFALGREEVRIIGGVPLLGRPAVASDKVVKAISGWLALTPTRAGAWPVFAPLLQGVWRADEKCFREALTMPGSSQTLF